MAGKWLRARQTKYAAYATVYIVVVVTIAVILNVLADRYNRSWDATANKRYTLSDQTAKVVRDLKQNSVIKFYYDRSDSLQPAHDLLDRYSNLSPRVRIEYVDSLKDPKAFRDAGLTSYGTAVVEVGDKKEQAKSLTEEGVTGAFIRTQKNEVRTICFVSGSGEHRIDDTDRSGLSELKTMLDKDNYVSKSISLLEKADIPADCTVVVVAGPVTEYQPSVVAAIQKFIEAGGRAFFQLDPPLKMGKPVIADNDALAAVLAGWGVTLDKDIVMDPAGQVFGLGPQIVLVTGYTYHPIVSDMRGIATGFPLARSMQTKNMDKTTVQQLFSSSESSLATSNMASSTFNPQDPNNKKGPLVIGAAGTFSTGKPDKEGRFVVIGNSHWTTNTGVHFNGNGDLAMNVLNWLSSDEDLISIRPKPPEDRQISMTRSQFWRMLVVAQGILPLLAVSAGVVVWWRRR